MWEMIATASLIASTAITPATPAGSKLRASWLSAERPQTAALGWARLQPIVVPLCTTFPGNPVLVFEGSTVTLRKPDPNEQ